ncbi:hypothetical protein [Mycolicibacterium austroafricanum]|uniref:hypothetical protein n=1 Tax=Mycolicibacterium austroafricanum TaxID=39687 RepID=UPI001CA3354C|nr:hypothetical protein [Mycolicibacterium austroafricanum]QZT62640.1 hypothetical protein JN085_27955 [Mycolicibacterium austroafricanum]
MGSRARVTAAACLMVSGLLVGGWTTATASADTDTGTTANADAPGGGADDQARPDTPAAAGGGTDRDPDVEPADGGAVAESDDAGDIPSRPTDPEPLPDPADGEPQAPDDAPVSEKPVSEKPVSEKEPEKPRPPCCKDGDKDCEPGWPWPWPWPDEPDDRPKPDDGYGEGRPEGVPSIRPLPGGVIRPGIEPPIAEPEDPGVLDSVPGIGVATGNGPEAPISVPIIVTGPTGGGASAGSSVAGTGGASGSPRQVVEPTPPRQLSPAPVGRDLAVPASVNRAGYGDYLRSAGISQVAALAVPGLAGILILTGVGGYVGYRQAKAGQGVRASGIARFTN